MIRCSDFLARCFTRTDNYFVTLVAYLLYSGIDFDDQNLIFREECCGDL